MSSVTLRGEPISYLEDANVDENEKDARRVAALVGCAEILPLEKSFSQQYDGERDEADDYHRLSFVFQAGQHKNSVLFHSPIRGRRPTLSTMTMLTDTITVPNVVYAAVAPQSLRWAVELFLVLTV